MTHVLTELTEEQKDWFAERLDESATGVIKVPPHLLKKYRKLTGITDDVPDGIVKARLIDQCY